MFNKIFSKFNKKQTDENKPSKLEVTEEISNIKEKDEKKTEILEEVISNDLIRIIVESCAIDDYKCFEFHKDSIKIYHLLPDYLSEIEYENTLGEICYYPNSDEKLHKNLYSEFNFKKDTIFSDGVFKYNKKTYFTKASNFSIVKDKLEDLVDFINDPIDYIDLIYKEVFEGENESDISERENLYLHIKINELEKVERILYFFKNIHSFNDLILLDKSYKNQSNKIQNEKELLIKELDSDGNGIIDISENNDFSLLLKSKQNLIIEFEKAEGKTYIQNFVKLSKYLKEKSNNIQSLFEIIKADSKIPNNKYNDFVGILKNEINTYNLMLLSSLNMIISLTEDDRITFYEIYESFDKLNVFTTNHEKEISIRLQNIDNKLDEVIQSIHDMEMNICQELYNLHFLTEDIHDSLSGLSDGLKEINSSIQTNNLLTGIQTYQMYKINMNTKSLRN